MVYLKYIYIYSSTVENHLNYSATDFFKT